MNFVKRAFALSLLVTAFATNVQARDLKGKTVYVDPEVIFSPFQEKFKTIEGAEQAKLQKELEPMIKEMGELSAKAKDLKDADAKKKNNDAMEALSKKAQAKQQAAQNKVMAEQQKIAKDAEAQVARMEEIRVKNEWDAILPSNVALAKAKDLDVTEIVKKQLNAHQGTVKHDSKSVTTTPSSKSLTPDRKSITNPDARPVEPAAAAA